MMGAMDIVETLGAKLVVLVPVGARFADVIAPVEICVQEGLASLSFDLRDLDLLRQVAPLYSTRARLGVHGVVTVDELDAAVGAGARFVLASVADADLVDAASRLGVACLPAALTPTEARLASRLGSGAVPVSVSPTTAAYALRQWFTAGAAAAVVGETLSQAALSETV